MTEAKTQTLNVPGAILRYDIRDAKAETTAPVLLMIGSPMDASGFTTLAEYFRDRTVVTYDPRGSGAASGPTAPQSPRRSNTRTTCTG